MSRQHVRWRHANQIWSEYLADSRFPQLDRWLAARLKKNKSFGKKDRNTYSSIVFAAARFGVFAAFSEFCSRKLSARFRWKSSGKISTSVLCELVSDFCQNAGRGSDSMRRAWQEIPVERFFYWVIHREPQCVAADRLMWPGSQDDLVLFEALKNACVFDPNDLKPFLIWNGLMPVWERALQERATISEWDAARLRQWIESHQTRPPLWLRLNDPDRIQTVLPELEQAQLSPQINGGAIRVEGTRSIFELEAFRKGWIEIQDYASQSVGESVPLIAGGCVWDACAGGGGKTLQLAARMKGKGTVVASDIREYKLDELRVRVRKAGFSNVRAVPWQGEASLPLDADLLGRGGFDSVLVDAPCSSSGTWRRNPDTRIRFGPESIASFSKTQFEILTAASRSIKKGGSLVYATCSVWVEENEGVVNRFLRASPEFKTVASRIHGNPEIDSDTLFSAVLLRS